MNEAKRVHDGSRGRGPAGLRQIDVIPVDSSRASSRGVPSRTHARMADNRRGASAFRGRRVCGSLADVALECRSQRVRSDFTGSLLDFVTSGDMLAAALVTACVQALALIAVWAGAI
jgi:hypothetical protein